MAIAVVLALSLPSASWSSAASPLTGRVRGRVVEWASGRPVGGATISLPQYGAKTTSAGDGSFTFPKPLQTENPYRPLTAVVTAARWGRWTIRGAPLYPGDTLSLRAELTRRPWTHDVVPSGVRGGPSAAAPQQALHSDTCTGWRHERVPPRYIRVFITDRGVSRKYRFIFYVKHVLPNEWLPFWDADALAAGAIAVKTYAAYRAMPGNAYSGGKKCADIRDDVYDQVFDPSWSTDATDQAVNRTFGSILFRDGGLFLSQYWNGHKGDPCAYVRGEYRGRMSQEGTYTCAKKGKAWPDIVQTFYPRTRWKHLYQLVLNPGMESAAMYPWKKSGKTRLRRVEGHAYKDERFVLLSPPRGGGTATIYQTRPFLGTAKTRYKAHAAFRCSSSHKSPCYSTIKVTAFPKRGRGIAVKKRVKIPSDGRWRLYRFDPHRYGKEHVKVRIRIKTSWKIALDTVGLKRA